MGTLSRNELGRRLQAIRGVIWQEALAGDWFAELLRDYPARLSTAPRGESRPSVSRSQLGAWMVRDPDVACRLLADERFGFRRADGGKAHLQVLPLPRAHLAQERAVQQAMVDAVRPVLGQAALRRSSGAVRRRAEQLLEGADTRTEFDLLNAYAAPLATAVLADVLGLQDGQRAVLAGHQLGLGLVPDAMVSPQTLPDVLALSWATREVEELLAEHGASGDTLGGMMAASVLFLATAPTVIARSVAHRLSVGTDHGPVDGALLRWPPLRLLTRVAHTDVDVEGHRVATDEQVVVPVTATGAPDRLLAREPQYALIRPLLSMTVEFAVDTLLGRHPGLGLSGPPRRRGRSPVTGALSEMRVMRR
ncbi:Cytochrome P450 [Amycolatopsis marina]|uniref:Cytochrome P450 n=1 Tax=Amycolatopsis marina TaxID=490629 RepID=A0A1I1BC79_9PSEU|nr:hypothetical protein [Amycolatopsis marina]SFB47881.1 Cytochrome P450 [Amycolatopsis marina]